MTSSAPLPSTLSPTDASGKVWDVVVIGAGPSGALAALELAQTGHRVLLVDKASFPRRKVCGCYLNQPALTTLQEVGLGTIAVSLRAVPVTRVRFGTDFRLAELALPNGAALSRSVLDAALVSEAIRAGAQFLPKTEARLGQAYDDYREVLLRSVDRITSIHSRIIVVADGIGGQVVRGCEELRFRTAARSLVGASAVTERLPDGYQKGTIHMAVGPAGYVGCLQVEDGRLEIAAAFQPNRLKECTGTGELAQRICDQSGLPRLHGLTKLRWTGTPPLSRVPTSRAAHRLFLVGDAAGFVEPFTGEGIGWALATGRAVAPLTARAVNDYSPALIRQWNQAHAGLLGPRHRLCRWLTRCLRRPRLVGMGVSTVAILPGLATPVIHWITRQPDYKTS